jgi:regulator of protease activity HflC (stomatin/prohibitin superfamily)
MRRLAGLVFALGTLGVLIVVFGSYYTVGAGEQAIVLRLGAVADVTGPGLHFKVPIIEDIRRVSTRVAFIEWSKANGNAMESYSRDQQPATLEVKIALRVTPDDKSITELYTTYRDFDGYVQTVVFPRALEGIKTVFGQFNAVTVIQERAQFNLKVEAEIRRQVTGPITIEGVQIQDISFSEAYEQSVEQRMQAQVEVERVQQNKAREQLQADIKVIQATADAQSVRLKGEAEGAAIRARAEALKDNPQLVALTAAEKWNGVLPTTMIPGSTVPFVTVPKQ